MRQKGKGLGLKELEDTLRFVKDNKLISRGLGIFTHPVTQAASLGAKQLGYGRKKAPKKRKVQKGGSFGSIFSDIVGGIGGGIGQGVGGLGRGIFGRGRKPKTLAKVLKM